MVGRNRSLAWPIKLPYFQFYDDYSQNFLNPFLVFVPSPENQWDKTICFDLNALVFWYRFFFFLGLVCFPRFCGKVRSFFWDRRWVTHLQEPLQNQKSVLHNLQKHLSSAKEECFKKIVKPIFLIYTSFPANFLLFFFFNNLHFLFTLFPVTVQHMMYGFGDDPNVSILQNFNIEPFLVLKISVLT